MKLIDEKEVEEAAEEFIYSRRRGFTDGVEFTEQKLLPMMVELLKFSSTKYTGIDGVFSPVVSNNIKDWIDAKQLLEQFLIHRQIEQLEKLLEFKSDDEVVELRNELDKLKNRVK